MTRAANPDLPDKIISEAERVVVASGHQAINMRRLAATVGVTATTIYHYFENREAILRQVRLNAAEKLNRRIRGIDESLPPHLFLAELGRQYLAFARENPNLYRLLFETQLGESDKKEDHSTLYYPYLAARGALERIASHDKGMPDPRHGAMMGWMMLHGFCSLMMSGVLPPAEGMTRASLEKLFMRYYSGGGLA
ncbi:MAG TPA: TetR/AcrR family transcriptional regulator [Spirochaetia bacterium]